jgi:hypothetical protein
MCVDFLNKTPCSLFEVNHTSEENTASIIREGKWPIMELVAV